MAERPLGTVLVTGAASGLGAATALAVADRGRPGARLDRVAAAGVEDAVADVEVRPGRRAGGRGRGACAGRPGRRPGRGVHPGRHGQVRDAGRGGRRRLGPGRAGEPDRHGGGGAGGPALPHRVARDRRHLRFHARVPGAVGRHRLLRVEVRRGRLHPGARRRAAGQGRRDHARSRAACGRRSSTTGTRSTSRRWTRSSTTRRTWPRRCCSRCASRPAARCASW